MPARSRTARRRQPWWHELPDEELLDLRLCDLELDLRRTPVQPTLERVLGELDRRGLRFRPHFWLGDEWFSPDGVPGVAIPFYLAHPRLMALERRFLHTVEGGEARWQRRILRHEIGHAIDTAYRLRRRKDWREVFGPASRPYPEAYHPRPGSRRFVLHLGHWYAQSHPCEDFAETFAVWLRPNSTWRTDYAGWPALRKLEFVDRLMAEIGDLVPPVRSREHVEPLKDNRTTLRRHYARKTEFYAPGETDRYDHGLLRVFGHAERNPRRPRASTFLRANAPQFARLLARRTRLHPYLIEHVLKLATARARELDLRLHRARAATKRPAFLLLARILHDFLRRGREHYAL